MIVVPALWLDVVATVAVAADADPITHIVSATPITMAEVILLYVLGIRNI